jgi:hypothetical protein
VTGKSKQETTSPFGYSSLGRRRALNEAVIARTAIAGRGNLFWVNSFSWEIPNPNKRSPRSFLARDDERKEQETHNRELSNSKQQTTSPFGYSSLERRRALNEVVIARTAIAGRGNLFWVNSISWEILTPNKRSPRSYLARDDVHFSILPPPSETRSEGTTNNKPTAK